MAKPNPFSDDEIKELKRGRGISPLGIITTNRFLDTIAELKSTVDYWDKVSERRYSVYAKLGRIWAKAVGKEGMIPDTGKLLNWLAEYIERLETALDFYADSNNYDEDGRVGNFVGDSPETDVWEDDNGVIARRAREGGREAMSLKDDPEWKEFKHNWAMSEIYKVIGFFFLVILLIAIKCDSANAQSARITFSSAWDLERQVNEIVAKCDTIWYTHTFYWDIYGNEHDSVYRVPSVITCRKLVDVAVAVPIRFLSGPLEHDGEKAHITLGGRAVVWWEEVRR